MRHTAFILLLVGLAAGCLREGQYVYQRAPRAASPTGLNGLVTHVHRRSALLILNLELSNTGRRAIDLGRPGAPRDAFALDVVDRRGLRPTVVVDPATGDPDSRRPTVAPGERLEIQLRWLFRPPLSGTRYRWRLRIRQDAGEDLVISGEAPDCNCPRDREPSLPLLDDG